MRQKPEERLSRCPDKIRAQNQTYPTDAGSPTDLYWSNPSVSETLIYSGSSSEKKKLRRDGRKEKRSRRIEAAPVWKRSQRMQR